MNTTRKQLEDALRILTALADPDLPSMVTHAVRLDIAGLHYGNVSARPEGWSLPGVAWAFPKDLRKIAKEIGTPSTPIDSLDTTDERVTMCGVTLPSADTDDNRQFTAGSGDVSRGRPFFTQMAVDVAGAASTDDMRPVLCGVHFCSDAIVATDSYRLYVANIPQGPSEPFTLHHKLIKAIARSKAETFTAELSSRTVDLTFTTSNNTFVTAKATPIEGDFPKYSQLFPDTWDYRTTLHSDPDIPIAAATKVANWTEGSSPAVLHMDTHLTIATSSTDSAQVAPITIGNTVRRPTGDSPSLPEITVGANPHFFKDALTFAGPDSHIYALSPLRPIMLRHGDRSALLMPIRLKDNDAA